MAEKLLPACEGGTFAREPAMFFANSPGPVSGYSFGIPEQPLQPAAARDGDRENRFQLLFGQLEESRGPADLARGRSPFSPPGVEVRAAHAMASGPAPAHTRSAAALHNEPSPPPAPSNLPAPSATLPVTRGAEVDATELGWYKPIQNPSPLEPLYEAMRQAGLDPGRFQFQQLAADARFPEHPEYDYVDHQVLIRGPNGSALFDLGLVLRTPWVTAVELRTMGIA